VRKQVSVHDPVYLFGIAEFWSPERHICDALWASIGERREDAANVDPRNWQSPCINEIWRQAPTAQHGTEASQQPARAAC
jgi:hypothetical protein